MANHYVFVTGCGISYDGPVWKLDPDDMSVVATSEDTKYLIFQGGLAHNGAYVYFGGDDDLTKLDPGTLEVLATATGISNVKNVIYDPDADCLWVTCYYGGNNCVVQVDPDDLSVLDSTPEYSANDYSGLACDASYIYYHTVDTISKILKVSKADLTTYVDSYDLASNMYDLIYYGGYLYFTHPITNDTFRKVQVSDMTEVDSESLTAVQYPLCTDGTYLYVAYNDTSGWGRQYTLSELSYVASTLGYGDGVNGNAVSPDLVYLYMSGDTDIRKVKQYDITDALTKTGESLALCPAGKSLYSIMTMESLAPELSVEQIDDYVRLTMTR